MSALHPAEVRFCLEICLTKLTGAVGQTADSHYSAKARFHNYPDVLVNSAEYREHQCPTNSVFLFNVNHRCRFTMTEKKLLSILPFAVTIDIVDKNGVVIGSASVPLRTAPNSASSVAKTGGGLIRSISLFDAYGKYAGVLEADCVIYPEPKDYVPPPPPIPQQPHPPLRSAESPSKRAAAATLNSSQQQPVQPLRASALGVPQLSPATPIKAQNAAANRNQQQQQQQIITIGDGHGHAANVSSAALGSHQSPVVLRVVVDETKFGGGRHADPTAAAAAVGRTASNTYSSAPLTTSTAATGHVATEESLFHFVQYDVVFQLRSITETLLTTLTNEEGRLGTVKVDKRLREDGRVERLLDAVEAVGWLSNVCLQVAVNIATGGGANGEASAGGGGPSGGSAARAGSVAPSPTAITYSGEPDRHKPNYSLSTVPPKKGTMLHLLRFEVLYQVQCQSVNLSLLVNKYRGALDQTMMGTVHHQHRTFFKRLAKAIIELNRMLNICVQATFDNNFRSASPTRARSNTRDHKATDGRSRRGSSGGGRRGRDRRDSRSDKRGSRGKGRKARSPSSSSSSSSDAYSDSFDSHKSSSSSSSSSYASDFSSSSSAKGAAKKPPPPPPVTTAPAAAAVSRPAPVVVSAPVPAPAPAPAVVAPPVVPPVAIPPPPPASALPAFAQSPAPLVQPLTINTSLPPRNDSAALATFTPLMTARDDVPPPPPPAQPSAAAPTAAVAATAPPPLQTAALAVPTASSSATTGSLNPPRGGLGTAAPSPMVITNPPAVAAAAPTPIPHKTVVLSASSLIHAPATPTPAAYATYTSPFSPLNTSAGITNPVTANTSTILPHGGYANMSANFNTSAVGAVAAAPAGGPSSNAAAAPSNAAAEPRNNSMFNADFRPFGSITTVANDGPQHRQSSAANSMTAVAAMHGIY